MDGLTPYLGFVLFVFVSITTPGPNNIMTLHSGARYGIARTVPLILGIQFGFALMITIIALGSSVLLSRIENAGAVLRIICFAYLLYLARRIATAPAPNLVGADPAPNHTDFNNDDSNADQGRPIGSIEAALFQWVNPKAWAVGIAAVGTYGFIFEGATGSMLGFTGTFLVIGLPSSFAWAGGGKLIGSLLRSPAQYRALSVTAAVLMIAAVVPALLQLG